jgi:hypothetical protein
MDQMRRRRGRQYSLNVNVVGWLSVDSFTYVVNKPYAGQIGEQAEASQSRLKYSAGGPDGELREIVRRNSDRAPSGIYLAPQFRRQ